MAIACSALCETHDYLPLETSLLHY